MGRKRLPPEMREYLAKIGRKGGLKGGRARMDTMTAEQRSDSARKAVQARWEKAKARRALRQVALADGGTGG